MNTKLSGIAITAVLMTGMMMFEPAWSQACLGDPACIEIKFKPDVGKAPDISDPDLLVERHVRKKIKRVRFAVQGPQNLEYATIRFICKDHDKYCEEKSPFVDSEGKRIEEFKVYRSGDKDLEIARFLQDCDHQCALSDRECIKKRCQYNYEIFNDKGEKLVDPGPIIEPR